ncbi:hypothetical protein IGI04_007937 [Brassica rapa subsp. trilocularis]|uniref:Uncharacterized protein n=1 Tax=Brassica rapa subsp. trilocularis TaxID=1813537 RepID=A0ABQ7NL66_BRACM|nr:hypothetical protein IGI04_007937 [Brassica rapa subsp. trilocularis]
MRSTVIGLPPYHVFSSEKLEDTTNDFGAASLFCEQGRHSSESERHQNEAEKSLPQSLPQKMEVLSNLRHLHLLENGFRDKPSVMSLLADPSIRGSYAHESAEDGRR